jgi:sterol desaturase/sphingolipid hydroxylase (fatty acid hydroxylase superfamily)
MKAITELAAYVLARLSTMSINRKGIFDALTFVAVLVFCLALEWHKQRSVRRYASRAFRTDLIYSMVYLSGIYSLLIGLPIYRYLTSHLSRWVPFAQTHALAHVPAVLQFAIGLVIADFTYYMWHRTVHAVPFLWAFHSVHHSQKELTIATSLRVHILEEMVRGLFYFVPFFIFAIPATVWLPVDIAINWLLFLEHSDLDWTYGWFGKVIVSPHYHRVHHSIETQDVDTNFGSFFSFWDRLFSTANLRATRPPAYGVPGQEVPESFTRQLAYPFVWLMRDRPAPLVVGKPAIE